MYSGHLTVFGSYLVGSIIISSKEIFMETKHTKTRQTILANTAEFFWSNMNLRFESLPLKLAIEVVCKKKKRSGTVIILIAIDAKPRKKIAKRL